MNNKIIKTIMVFVSTLISSLITPIFGQLYAQQTGIQPFVFYGITLLGGLGIAITILYHIWNND
jgi:predicted Na+-dependent transporter